MLHLKCSCVLLMLFVSGLWAGCAKKDGSSDAEDLRCVPQVGGGDGLRVWSFEAPRKNRSFVRVVTNQADYRNLLRSKRVKPDRTDGRPPCVDFRREQLVFISWGGAPPEHSCLRLETGPPKSPSARLHWVPAGKQVATKSTSGQWCLPRRTKGGPVDPQRYGVMAVAVPRTPHVQVALQRRDRIGATPHDFIDHQGPGYSVWVRESPPPLSTRLGVSTSNLLIRQRPGAYRTSRMGVRMVSAGVAVLRNKVALSRFCSMTSHHSLRTLPQLDFRSEMAVVVYWGSVGTRGYGLRLRSVAASPGSVRLLVHATVPKGPVGPAVSHPGLLIVVPRRPQVEVTISGEGHRRPPHSASPWTRGFSAFMGPGLQVNLRKLAAPRNFL